MVSHIVFEQSASQPHAFAAITAAVGSAPVVLADGHHRFETACTYRDELRAAIDAFIERKEMLLEQAQMAAAVACARCKGLA